MNAIGKRLAKLEAVMLSEPDGLDALNDVELYLACEQMCRTLLDRAESEDERAEATAWLAEIEGERQEWVWFYSRPDIAAAVESNRAAGIHAWYGPSCTCGSLPYPHQPHKPTEEVMAHVAAWHGERKGARA